MGVSIFHIPLTFAKVKIPVIVVLTKYDLLVMEHYRACSQTLSVTEKKVEATKRAKLAFNKVTKELKVPFVPVSTKKEALKEYGGLLI
jgi:GTPase